MNSFGKCKCSSTNLSRDLDFATYFSHLLKTKTCVDVTFILETSEGEIEFVAHQFILAMRSSYFASEFYGDQKKREHRTVRLKGINLKAFEDMIWYCYDVQPGLITIRETGALFQVANQFKVASLVKVCCSHLRDFKLEPRNVFTLLEVSDYMGDKNIKDMCTIFIEDNTISVLESYELSEITPAMIQIILNLSQLSFFSEYKLIKWTFDWAKVKSEEKDFGSKSIREYLESFLQRMNFLDLTFKEFAMLCKDYPNCFNSDEIASIFMNIVHPKCWKMPDWFDENLKFRVYNGWKSLYIGEHINKNIENLHTIIRHNLKVEEECMEFLAELRNYEQDIEKIFKSYHRHLGKLIVGCHEKLKQKKMSKTDFNKTKQYEFDVFAKDEKKVETIMKILIEEDYLPLEKIRDILEMDDRTFKMMEALLYNNEEFESIRKDLEHYYVSRRKIKCKSSLLIEMIKTSSEKHNQLQEKLRMLLELKLSHY